MKISLIFLDWTRDGKSIYHTNEGMRLSLGNFHSGTTFDANIVLNDEHEAQLRDALAVGVTPVFYVGTTTDNEDMTLICKDDLNSILCGLDDYGESDIGLRTACSIMN